MGGIARISRAAAVAAALVTLAACTTSGTAESGTAEQSATPSSPAPEVSSSTDLPVLRDLAPDDLLIGAAVAGGGHHRSAGYPDPFPSDEPYRDLLAREFSTLTPENQLKWEAVHPERDRYDFAAADAIVDFAEANGQEVRGHTLLWYSQNPGWLRDGDFSDDELRDILRDHITTVVGHYEGRIEAWDVANEVLDRSGELRTGGNVFLERLGMDAVADAFRWAHEADPDATLYLNDFGLERGGPKVDAYLDLVRELQDDDVPIDGFGLQGHLSLGSPFPNEMESVLDEFADLGLEVAVTELDVRIPLDGGPPSDDDLERQADYFGRAVEACVEVDACRSITLWGLPDRYSWVPSTFPDEGAATPFADDLTPKPAFGAIADALRAG